MATNVISIAGRGDNKRQTVHFDSDGLNLKRERSGLSGSACRKQQKELRRQKKVAEERAAEEEEERETMRQMAKAYRILKTDGFKDRVLALVENEDFAETLDEFLMAAGAPGGPQTLRGKLQWFREKHGDRELNDHFLSRTYVCRVLHYLCRTTVFRMEMEFCFVSVVPHASSSESETTHNVLLSAEQRRALEEAVHGSATFVAKNMRPTFADSATTSEDSPTAAGSNNAANESSAAALPAVVLLEHEHAVSGVDFVLKAPAAEANSDPAPKTAARESPSVVGSTRTRLQRRLLG